MMLVNGQEKLYVINWELKRLWKISHGKSFCFTFPFFTVFSETSTFEEESLSTTSYEKFS